MNDLLVRCAVHQCGERVRFGLEMCEPHWNLLSRAMQISICRLHERWNESADEKDFHEWRDAVHVAAKEVRARKHPLISQPPHK